VEELGSSEEAGLSGKVSLSEEIGRLLGSDGEGRRGRFSVVLSRWVLGLRHQVESGVVPSRRIQDRALAGLDAFQPGPVASVSLVMSDLLQVEQ
jgi:hypothetical protein